MTAPSRSSSDRWDTTYDTLRSDGECVVAIPGTDLMETTVDVGNSSSAHVNKWERFGLTPLPASTIGAPLITATGPGGATMLASSSAVRSTSSRCSGSSRRRSQAALSRSYMKRKNQCGAGTAATLRVRLPARVPDAIHELVVEDQRPRNDTC
jgi:hypothetical protein